MKKLLALLLAIVMVLSLAACHRSQSDDIDDEDDKATEDITEDPTTPSDTDPTEPPTEPANPAEALAAALANTYSDMQACAAYSPLETIAGTAGTAKNGALDFSMDMTRDGAYLGAISTTLNADTANHRYFLNAGIHGPAGEQIDMAAYLDKDCLAFSSDQITGGDFYGITFQTLVADLQKSGLAAGMDEFSLLLMDSYMNTLTEAMNQEPLDVVALLTPYVEILQNFNAELVYVPGTETLNIGGLDSTNLSCTTYAAQTDVDDILAVAIEVLKTAQTDETLASLFNNALVGAAAEYGAVTEIQDALDSAIEALEESAEMLSGTLTNTYYVYNDRLIAERVSGTLSAEGEDVTIDMDLLISYGVNPSLGNWSIRCELTNKEEDEAVIFEISLSQKTVGTVYTSNLQIVISLPGEENRVLSLDTTWDQDSGDLEITGTMQDEFETRSGTLYANLLVDTDSITFTMDVGKTIPMNDGLGAIITIAYHAGEPFEKPDYVNLDQWDAETLAELVSNAEKLFG